MVQPSDTLVLPTWIAAIASLVTAAVLAVTLSIAWANLIAFKSAERVRRTSELFFNFYTEEYVVENEVFNAPPLRRTPFMAMNSVILAPKIVKSEIVTIVHNYLEAVAALHWKNLIDSDLYFDSFAVLITDVYGPLAERLRESRDPLTPYSRIPRFHADAKAYLARRKAAANS